MDKREIFKKNKLLESELKRFDHVAIAFSGGIDSTYLLHMAIRSLGKEHVVAVTAFSETFPEREREDVISLAADMNIPLITIETEEVSEINRRGNPKNRCYFCKKELFFRIKEHLAPAEYQILEGSNLDDDHDFRPGLLAVKEHGVLSPLKKVGLRKEEIRFLAHYAGLKNWDKPAYACLTSRFPYHVNISVDDLIRVEKAERFLQDIGFRQCRVRCYGTKAIIEVDKIQLEKLLENEKDVVSVLHRYGFQEIEIDKQGYRTGRMNEE